MQRDEPEPRRVVVIALLLLVAASGLLFVILGNFWVDENWYYAGSWLVAHGSLPHVDFFIHHNPLFFYVYGLVQKVAGPSLLVGRVESWALWSMSVLLLTRLAWKSGGPTAATLFLVLVAANPFATRYFTTLTWRPLELSLLAVAVTILSSERLGRGRYPVVALMLALVVGLRFPVDLGSVILGLFLVYVTLRYRKETRVVVASYAAPGLVLAALLFPYLWRAPALYLFDVVRYPLSMVSYQRSFGLLAEWGGQVSQLFSVIHLLGEELRYFFASVSLFLIVVTYRVIELRGLGAGGWRGWLRNREEWWWLIMAYVLIGELMMTVSALVSSQGTPVTRIVPFMLASLLASVECARLARAAATPETRAVVSAAAGIVIILAVFLQSPGGVSLHSRWSESDLFRLRHAAATVRALTPAGKSILTFQPALATEADRRIALDMIMEVWVVFPTWDTETCTKYHLTNIPMLLDAIEKRQVGAIVLGRPGRLEDDTGMGMVLRPYRARIRAAIEAGYRRVASVAGPREGRSGPVSIDLYVPR